MKRYLAAAMGLIGLGIGLTGCSTDDVHVALQDYHDANPACFRVSVPFPTDNPGSRVMLKGNHAQVKALVKAGVVEKRGAQFEYHLTDKAKLTKTDNPTRDSNFCFGEYQVVRILHVGEVIEVAGGTTSYVEYEYQLTNVADWVAHPAMTKALFPKLHAQLVWHNNAKKAKAPMVKTNEGWVHFQMAQKR